MLNTRIREVMVRLSAGTLTIVAKVLRYFPQSLPARVEIVFLPGHDRFLPIVAILVQSSY
jgi:hypothetical protein